MKSIKLLSASLSLLGFILILSACQKDDPAVDQPIQSAQPVFTEVRDLDQDGRPELIIGFDQKDIINLEQPEVILEGRFSDTDTRFETDGFRVEQ